MLWRKAPIRRALGVFGEFSDSVEQRQQEELDHQQLQLFFAGPREVPRDPLRQVEGDAEVPVWIGYWVILGTLGYLVVGRVFLC